MRNFLFVGFTIPMLMADPSVARAECGDSDKIRCYPDLGAITGVVWSGDGFRAVGQPKQPNPAYGLVVRHLTRAGQPKNTPLFKVPLPLNLVSRDKPIVGVSRKIIAIPDGGLIILGSLTLSEDDQVPWAVRLAANGTTVWNKAFPAEPGVTTIFHSGVYDQANDRLVVVGRRTSGSDDKGNCANWSQSLVISLKISNGQPEFQPLYSGAQAAGPRNRQALHDIASGDKKNSYIVAGFASAPHSTSSGYCQDDISVQTLSLLPSGAWSLSTANKIGQSNANEIAYAIKPVRPGSYLIAGYGPESGKNVQVPKAFLVTVTPTFSVLASTSTPFPLDGLDKNGAGRFRAIASSPDKQNFALVGAGTEIQRVTHGIWGTVQSELKQSLSMSQFKNRNGSDILDAAVSDKGEIIGVGKWTSEDDRQIYGWSGSLGNLLGSSGPELKISRRPPDRTLPTIESLPFSGNAHQLPQTVSQSRLGYSGKMLQPGGEVNFAFFLPTTRTMRISVRPETGNVGLVLLDSDKRPLTFSNFGGTATELVTTTLVAGNYSFSIFANAEVKSYELKLDSVAEKDALLSLQQLKDEEKERLSKKLISAGYSYSLETDIALGSETLRSIYAMQQSVGDARPISQTTLAPLVRIPSQAQ